MKRITYKTGFAKRAEAVNQRAKTFGAKGKITEHSIKNLYVKQMGKCVCCNQLLEGEFEIDHIIPLSKGGSNYIENLQLLKPKCNNAKRANYEIKCFRHQVKPSDQSCRICEALTEAKGDIELAKLIFTKRRAWK